TSANVAEANLNMLFAFIMALPARDTTIA
ncbi:hypothetical protein Tco_1280183, partial [Tanacetum coccineum]